MSECTCHIAPPCEHCVGLRECSRCGTVVRDGRLDDVGLCEACAEVGARELADLAAKSIWENLTEAQRDEAIRKAKQ